MSARKAAPDALVPDIRPNTVSSTPRRYRSATEQIVLDDFTGVNFIYVGVTSTFFRTDGPNGALDRSGGNSNRINVWDGIVGVRGAVELGAGGDWFLPYYLDIGAGNYSNWTWQGWAGVGYRFDWGDLVLVYRNLSYSTSGNEILEDMRLAGPALGATFRW